MMFINTRPAERAKNLTAFLQAQNINVLELPLLDLVECELSQQEKIALENLTQANFYQALIFISETAVNYFFGFVQTHNIQLNPNLTFIAVGQKTAQIFKNFWQKLISFPSNVITPSQFNLPENNDGLLQLPVIKKLKKGENLLLLKGKEGRALLKNRLIEKEICVHEVDFYQRIFPPNSEIIFQHICQTFPKKTIVLITSLAAWQYWQALLLPLLDKPLNVHYLVLQSRIAETVRESTLNFTILSSLEPNEILEKIKLLP